MNILPFSEPHLPIVRCVVLANDAVLKVELIYLFIIIFFLEINFSQVFMQQWQGKGLELGGNSAAFLRQN